MPAQGAGSRAHNMPEIRAALGARDISFGPTMQAACLSHLRRAPRCSTDGKLLAVNVARAQRRRQLYAFYAQATHGHTVEPVRPGHAFLGHDDGERRHSNFQMAAGFMTQKPGFFARFPIFAARC